MKKIFTLACSALLTLHADAQTTITYAQYSGFTPGLDTFRKFTTPSVTPAVNGSWDLSAATYGGVDVYTKTPYSNPAMPGVSYFQNSTYTFAALSYDAKVGYGITSQGFGKFGEAISRQAYGLGGITMNPNDSLVFPSQVVVYSSMRKAFAFPATFGSNWSSNLHISTNYEISVAAYGLNATPGYRRAHLTQQDSVKGWGKARVKRLDGSVSGWMDVLAVKSTVQIKDSFYLNGSPAPTPLLSALGLSQGMMNYENRINYFRAGEIEPLIYTRFTDATFTTNDYSDVHMNRLPQPVSVAGLPDGVNDVRLFPNPASGNFFIEVTETAAGTWSYQLLNSAGQVTANESLELNGGKARVSVQNAVPGSYFLQLHKNGQPVVSKPLVITN